MHLKGRSANKTNTAQHEHYDIELTLDKVTMVTVIGKDALHLQFDEPEGPKCKQTERHATRALRH